MDGSNYSFSSHTIPDGTGSYGYSASDPALNFTTPPQQTFDEPEMKGSIQKILADNIGEYVVIELLIGTECMERKQGQLTHVGTSYVTLFDDINRDFILCDLYSIKFVYFFFPGDRPDRNYNYLPPDILMQ